VWIEDVTKYKGTNWVKIKDNGWFPREKVRRFFKVKRPEKIRSNDKWIHVKVSEQTLGAYEGDRLVYATLVSTGRPAKETKRGLFRIYNRLETARMAGDVGDPNYFLFENIPFHLYFYRHLAIHGAYARERFGIKGSHGCVNLSMKDAEWIWNWTGGKENVGKLGPDFDPPIQGEFVWIED
jgi:hypothetical protein